MHIILILVAGILSGFTFAFGYGLGVAFLRRLFRGR